MTCNGALSKRCSCRNTWIRRANPRSKDAFMLRCVKQGERHTLCTNTAHFRRACSKATRAEEFKMKQPSAHLCPFPFQNPSILSKYRPVHHHCTAARRRPGPMVHRWGIPKGHWCGGRIAACRPAVPVECEDSRKNFEYEQNILHKCSRGH